jgi:hypothetical protein
MMAQLSTTSNQPNVLGGQTALGIVNSIMARGRANLFGTGARGGVSLGARAAGGHAWKDPVIKDEAAPVQAAPQPVINQAPAQRPQKSQKAQDAKDDVAADAQDDQKAQDAKDDAEADAAPDQLSQSIQNAGNQQGAIPDGSANNYGMSDNTSPDTLGGTESYDKGGAIPDADGDYDDENQSTPPIQVASSEPQAEAAPQQAAIPEDDNQLGPPQGPLAPVGQAMQDAGPKIMAYLHGAGAAAKDAVLRAAQAITPGMDQAVAGGIPENPNQPAPQAAPQQGAVDPLPGDAAKSVANVAQTQGEDAAQAHIQRMRIEYQHGMALATTALNAGHKAAAAQMATNAYTWLPDGVTASFTPTNGGMVAHIMGADGKAQDYPLSDQSFNELIHIGKAGQFDTLLHKGGIGQVAAVLSARDSAVPAAAQAKAQAGEDDEDEAPAPAQSGVPGPKQRSKVVTILPGPNNHGAKPSYQLIGGAAGQPASKDDSVETRAMRRAYGGPGEQQEQNYIDTEAQTAAGYKNKLDIATKQGENAANIAQIRGGVSERNNTRTNDTRAANNTANNLNRQQIEAMKSADRKALLQQKISQAHDLAVRGDLTNARAALDTAVVAGGGFKSLSPEHQALYNYVVSRVNNPGAYSQQGAPAPQQAAPAPTQKPAPQQNNRAALEAEMRRRGLLQ